MSGIRFPDLNNKVINIGYGGCDEYDSNHN
jgi:hypothetical protein